MLMAAEEKKPWKLVEFARSTIIRDADYKMSTPFLSFFPVRSISPLRHSFLQLDVTLMALNVVRGRDIPGIQLVSH